MSGGGAFQTIRNSMTTREFYLFGLGGVQTQQNARRRGRAVDIRGGVGTMS